MNIKPRLGVKMSQDKKYREFWNPGDDSTPDSYYIEIAALDELKAELAVAKVFMNDARKEADELKAENQIIRTNYEGLRLQNLELTACLRDMVGALEGCDCANDNEEFDSDFSCPFCKCLTKHADLIGKLK
jgi:hypothetical protein